MATRSLPAARATYGDAAASRAVHGATATRSIAEELAETEARAAQAAAAAGAPLHRRPDSSELLSSAGKLTCERAGGSGGGSHASAGAAASAHCREAGHVSGDSSAGKALMNAALDGASTSAALACAA
jgi:hypothetical protein